MNRIFILFFAASLVSCSSETPVERRAMSNSEMRDMIIKRIDSLETTMKNQNLQPDDELTANLLQTYVEFSERYPADLENTPKFLYKAAAIARSVDLPVKALKFYDKIMTDYPNWEKGPEVAFLNAFTYDEDLKEAKLAKEAYEQVIEKYPGDHWAIQAEQRLATIEMSDEELLEFLRQKQAENAAAESN
ncbi:MAG: hypothetical protein AAGC47_00315 [Bacteroidota bacterium]